MALLSRLPPEGRKRSGNKADKEPDGSGVRQGIGGADPLGETQKAHGPANPQGKENVPVFPDAPSGMGQCLHHRAVYVEHHGQHAAGDAGQNRPRADQRTAQQIPQPAYMGPSYSTSSLKLYTGYHISIPRSAQSETVNDLRILAVLKELTP